jgi:hypothetical protein
MFMLTTVFSQEDAWVYFTAKNNSHSFTMIHLLNAVAKSFDKGNQNIVFRKDIPIDLPI